jgi:hypothetical protein
LKSLEGLKDLWLQGTSVTNEGAAELKAAIPNVEVGATFK